MLHKHRCENIKSYSYCVREQGTNNNVFRPKREELRKVGQNSIIRRFIICRLPQIRVLLSQGDDMAGWNA
jgi:hypothetical protein